MLLRVLNDVSATPSSATYTRSTSRKRSHTTTHTRPCGITGCPARHRVRRRSRQGLVEVPAASDDADDSAITERLLGAPMRFMIALPPRPRAGDRATERRPHSALRRQANAPSRYRRQAVRVDFGWLHSPRDGIRTAWRSHRPANHRSRCSCSCLGGPHPATEAPWPCPNQGSTMRSPWPEPWSRESP
jgi:hypothetical protein